MQNERLQKFKPGWQHYFTLTLYTILFPIILLVLAGIFVHSLFRRKIYFSSIGQKQPIPQDFEYESEINIRLNGLASKPLTRISNQNYIEPTMYGSTLFNPWNRELLIKKTAEFINKVVELNPHIKINIDAFSLGAMKLKLLTKELSDSALHKIDIIKIMSGPYNLKPKNLAGPSLWALSKIGSIFLNLKNFFNISKDDNKKIVEKMDSAKFYISHATGDSVVNIYGSKKTVNKLLEYNKGVKICFDNLTEPSPDLRPHYKYGHPHHFKPPLDKFVARNRPFEKSTPHHK